MICLGKGIMNSIMKSPFIKGILDGVPIALGYLSVSFGFGILAVRSGLTSLVSVVISASNLTSAGQAAGIAIIAAGGASCDEKSSVAMSRYLRKAGYNVLIDELSGYAKWALKNMLPDRTIVNVNIKVVFVNGIYCLYLYIRMPVK